MKKFFNWVMVIAGIVGAFYMIGLIVPRNQTQGSKTTLNAKPDQLYDVVSDLTTWSDWNPDVAAVRERPERNGHPIWEITDKKGITHDLEVMVQDDAAAWQGTYTIEGTRYTLRFDFGWYGQGGRARVTKTVDTHDTWQRAWRFLWSPDEASPIALLNALSQHLGEAANAEGN